MNEENFAVFNLVMSTTDFSKCDTAQDSLRELYRGLYPYMRQQHLIIRMMAMILEEKGALGDERLSIFKESLDIFKSAERRLNIDKKDIQRKRRMKLENPNQVRDSQQAPDPLHAPKP